MIDNWIEIVETLQQCMRGNLKEAKYQQEIENCLKFLGWRTSNKTMQSQLILGFGSGSKLRPDITLYKNGIPVLPIEIKRPDNVCNDKQIGQLGNYMRQLKLNVGLYFGENIRFYYDNPNDLDNPINVFSVEFSEEDTNGMLFCEMLSYEKFDIKKMDDFCKEHYNQIVSRNNLCQRFSEFFAENIVTKNIVTLIKDKFIKEGFDEYVINDELSQLICRIEWKHTPKIVKQTDNSVINISETEKNETKFSLDGDKYWGVGRFVLAVVKRYVSEHPDITLEELEEVFPSELNSSSKQGVIRSIEFLNEHPNYRFYKKEDELIRLKNNQYIAVNTQWGNTGYSRPHFQKFLEHVRHFYHVYSI